ncbi:transposase [Fragilaria crotonensis]|nr:transposase [Fragilaria crotonensis]
MDSSTSNSVVDINGNGGTLVGATGATVMHSGTGAGFVFTMQTDREDEGRSSNALLTLVNRHPTPYAAADVVVGDGRASEVTTAAAAGRPQNNNDEQEQGLSSAGSGEDGNDVLVANNRAGVVAGGRTKNECWSFLSTESGQHLVIETKCMKCGQMVRHHKKSEKVKAHLNRCRPFLNSLRSAGLNDNDVPDWVVLRNDAKKNTNTSLFASYPRAAAVLGSESSPSATTHPSTSTPSMSASYGASSSNVNKINKKKRARTMRDYLIPPLSPTDQAAFQEDIAMHFYMSATPFARMDEPHLLQSLKKLRPDVKLPTRKDLSGKLLRSAHKKVKSKVDNWLKKDQFACVTSDAWSNIKNESVINYYMMVSGDVTFFLESTQSGELSHTSEYLATDLDRVICLTQGKISGVVVMDTTAANKKTWKILKERHPAMFFQGCVAHGLHLLVKDVFDATKAKSNRPVADYPEGYPFEPLLIFAADCKKVVKYFHNHHAPKAMLKKALHAAGHKMLVQVAATRWGSLIGMVRSLLAAEEVLYQLVTSRDFVTGSAAQKVEQQAIANIITNHLFVVLLKKTIEILTPIDAAIVY